MPKQTSFRATRMGTSASSIVWQKGGASSQANPRRPGRPTLLHAPSMLSHKAIFNQTTNVIDDVDDNHEAHEAALASDIAECISNELKTLALIAALLSSWAATVYAGELPMDKGLCLGPSMVRAAYVIFWISLGWFFLCISSILAIIADLDGVPRQFLFKHLQQRWVRVIYQVPEVSMIGGVIFLALGYALDIGERAGCAFLGFGIFAAVGFVGLVGVLFVLLKRARQDLCRHEETDKNNGYLGKSFIATWRDRMDKHTRRLSTRSCSEIVSSAHSAHSNSHESFKENPEEEIGTSEEFYRDESNGYGTDISAEDSYRARYGGQA